MKINRLLIVSLSWLLVSTLVSCQTLKKVNRKPQLAGFGAYCSNCLLKGLDKDINQLRHTIKQNNPNVVKSQVSKNPVSVRSVVVFNKEGKPVCHVDLLKHKNLVPNFAKPGTSKIVHQEVNKYQRRLASVEEKSSLPSCTGKYLSALKRTAKYGMIADGDKSHIHKTNIGPNVVITCQKAVNELHLRKMRGFEDNKVRSFLFKFSCAAATGIIVTYYENIMKMDKDYVLTGAQRDELHAKLGKIESETQKELFKFNQKIQKLKSKKESEALQSK